MSVSNRMKKVILEFPSTTGNPADLHRLDQFVRDMKRAGILKKPEYNIPQRATAGEVSLNTSTSLTSLNPSSFSLSEETN
jgi:hypothetical protein